MKNYTLIDLWQDKSKINQYLSNTLLTQIEKNILENKKIILYLNKRGAYDLSICLDCNNIKKCPRCDISLSIHKNPLKNICHHCFYSEEVSLTCEKCASLNLKNIWVWTQQIEESLIKNFPNIKIFRLDSDSVRNNSLKSQVLENINNSQVIIWTKMITTWFDFRNIWLIWVILLEQELQIPKYDTQEKIYQNIKQLIWRWGRLWEHTDILLQTFSPKNEMIKNIISLNYKDFFKKTLNERKVFLYPPFTQIATLRYKDKDKQKSIDFIKKFKNTLDSFNWWNYEIILIDTPVKRDNQFFTKIIIKWLDINSFLQNVKKEIFKNPDLAVIFE